MREKDEPKKITKLIGILLSVVLFGGCTPSNRNNLEQNTTAPEETEQTTVGETDENGENTENQTVSETTEGMTKNTTLALNQSCTNEPIGYQINYPVSWLTNSGEVVPQCQIFDPQSAQVPPQTESFDRAIYIRSDEVSFERAIAEERGSRELSHETTTIDGDQVVVVEEESTGFALLPEGIRSYLYLVNLDGETLVAVTYDVKGQNYDRNKQVLDRMMNTIQFTGADNS